MQRHFKESRVVMKKELVEKLVTEYLAVSSVPENQKGKVLKLVDKMSSNVDFLYDVYHSLHSGYENPIKSKNEELFFETGNEKFLLRDKATGIFLEKEDMKILVRDMIALLEEVLPLGSVVDLKKEEFEDRFNLNGLSNFRVIVSKRFQGIGDDLYYPYSVLLYPFGTIGNGRSLSITPALIENVVFKGYQDEAEEDFVYQAKKTLICDQRRKSVGFASKDELQKIQKEMEETLKNGKK